MKSDNYFIEYVIELAIKNVASGNGGPFAAVIVKEGEIVATGVNSVTAENDPTSHAEIKAIRNACSELNNYQLDDCTIYSSCEPCPMCLGAIYWARPNRLVFAADKQEAANAGFDDNFIYKELEKPLEYRALESKHIKHDLRKIPFQKWMSIDNKKEY
jgi:guanine deaminase